MLLVVAIAIELVLVMVAEPFMLVVGVWVGV